MCFVPLPGGGAGIDVAYVGFRMHRVEDPGFGK